VRVAFLGVLRQCHNYENDDAPWLSPRQVVRRCTAARSTRS
jgi:hypothetical protein